MTGFAACLVIHASPERPALKQSASRWIPPRALALAIVSLAIMSAAGLFSDHAGAAQNDHGLVYSVWFAPPPPGEAAVPMTVQDQVWVQRLRVQ